MKIGKLRNCSRICGPWFGSELSKNSQSLWVVAHTTTLKPDPEGRQSFRGLFYPQLDHLNLRHSLLFIFLMAVGLF